MTIKRKTHSNRKLPILFFCIGAYIFSPENAVLASGNSLDKNKILNIISESAKAKSGKRSIKENMKKNTENPTEKVANTETKVMDYGILPSVSPSNRDDVLRRRFEGDSLAFSHDTKGMGVTGYAMFKKPDLSFKKGQTVKDTAKKIEQKTIPANTKATEKNLVASSLNYKSKTNKSPSQFKLYY